MGSGGGSMPKPPKPPSPEDVLKQNEELVTKRMLSLERALSMTQNAGPAQLIGNPSAPRPTSPTMDQNNPYNRNRAGIRYI